MRDSTMVFWATAALAKMSRKLIICWLVLSVMAALAPKLLLEEVSQLMLHASVKAVVQWATQLFHVCLRGGQH